MRKFLVHGVILMIIVSAFSTISAQDDVQSWEYLVGNMNGGPLYSITEDGVTELTIPPSNTLPNYNTSLFELISDDNTLGAFVGNIYGAQSITDLNIVDFANDTCCVQLEEPFALNSYDVMAFSDDNTLLLASMSPAFDDDADPIIGIWDTTTGSLVASQLLDDLPRPADIIEFTAELLVYRDSQITSETIWDVPNNEYAIVPLDFPPVGCERANLATGEQIVTVWDDAYGMIIPPYETSSGQITAPDNTVAYENTACDDTDEYTTIYHDPDRLYVIGADWVLDGEAVLIRHADINERDDTPRLLDDAVLLFRDQRRITVRMTQAMPHYMIYGTPTGWVSVELIPTDNEFVSDGIFYLNTVEDDVVTTVELGQVSNININNVLRAPELGQNIGSEPTFAPHVNP